MGYVAQASCCNTSLATGGSKSFSATTTASDGGLGYVQMLACQKTVEPVPAPIPAGMTIFYEGLSCPTGWTQDTSTTGRFPASADSPAQNILAAGGGKEGFAGSGNYSVGGTTNMSAVNFPYLQLLQYTKGAAGPPKITGILNGASYASNAIAPGEIIAIFGENLGPEEGAGAKLQDGHLATVVGDVSVRIDGRAAPIFYASSAQVNVQVPYRTSRTSAVTVSYLNQTSASFTAPAASSAPGLFVFAAPNNDEVIAVIDGALASADQPVPVHKPFVLYATGGGLTNPATEDGAPRGLPLAMPIQQLTLTVGGVGAILDYAGAAPGFVGLMQINARLAAGTPSGKVPIKLQIGSSVSPSGANLWVQ